MEKFFPYEGYLFDTHQKVQNEFIHRVEKDGVESAFEWLKNGNGIGLTYPEKLTFKWEPETTEEYKFEISKDADFKDAFVLNLSSPECELDNFEIGQKYFWRVNGGKVHHFETEDNIFRFIRIDGLANVRDIGGNKIKQGMAYRGSKLDEDCTITEKGKKTFCDELKIRTQLDLRKESVGVLTSSQAGESVNYTLLPYRPYKEIFEDKHRQTICKIMEIYSDPENYPIYVHCAGGADRTGMIALFLRALLGESDEVIYLDYELTSLNSYDGGAGEGVFTVFRSRNGSYFKEFLDILDKYAPSKPLSEQVKAFLLDCGVSIDCINKIINILKKE